MPRFYRRNRRFRRYRRRRPLYNARGTVSRYASMQPTSRYRPIPVSRGIGQPDKMIVRMRFAINGGDVNAITSTSGSVVDYVYRANDCYDPYQGGAGAQPRCFDQWMALYRHGIVLGSKILIRFFFPTGATAENNMKVFIGSSETTTAFTTSQAEEVRRTRQTVLTCQRGGVILSNTFSYKMIAHNPEDFYALQFSGAGQPTQQWYYHVGGFGLNSQSESCDFTGHIDYTVLLIHPLDPGQS